MIHTFEVEIAQEFGLNSAILLNNLWYWSEKNRCNGDNFYDGRYWVYHTIGAFYETFPYMTKNVISNTLNKLVDAGILMKGNYNRVKFDRTTWYAFTDLGIEIMTRKLFENNSQSEEKSELKSEKELTENEDELTKNSEKPNAFLKNVKSSSEIKKSSTQNDDLRSHEITNSEVTNLQILNSSNRNTYTVNNKLNKNNNKNINKENTKETFVSLLDSYTNNSELRSALDGFAEMRKAMKGFTPRALKLNLHKLDSLASNDEEKIQIVNQTVENGWKGFYSMKEPRSEPPKKVPMPDYWGKDQKQETMTDAEMDDLLRLQKEMSDDGKREEIDPDIPF